MKNLPPYIIINNPNEKNAQILKNPASPLSFPLSKKDKEHIQILIDKYDQEKTCVGLAAPQIGIGKQFIFVHIPDDPNLKKWRNKKSLPPYLWKLIFDLADS